MVLNATGIFTDSVRKMDDAAAKPILNVAQGTHIVLDKSFLPGTRLDLVLPELGQVALAELGHRLGVLLARLACMPMPRSMP